MARTLEQFFKKHFLYLLEKILGKPMLKPSAVDLQAIKRILVIRQHDQLGDLLLSTPVLRALRAHFPQAFIAVMVRNYTFEVMQHNACIDQVILFREKIGSYSYRWLRQFCQQLFAGYDLTIVLNTVSHSLTSDLFAWLSRARFILGSEHLKFPGSQRNFLYNLLAPYDEKTKNQTERNLDIVRYLAVNTSDLGEMMTLRPAEIRWARRVLKKTDELVIGVHPGAGKLPNRWPIERFKALILALQEHYRPLFVLSWGPKEQDLGQELLGIPGIRYVLANNLKLRQLAAIMAQMDLFFCNDTGVMHLAAAVETPLVAIFGPTDPEQWKPPGDRFIAVRHPSNRCEEVALDQVLAAGKRLLGC